MSEVAQLVPTIQPVILTMFGRRQAWEQTLYWVFVDQTGYRTALVHADAAAEGAARAPMQRSPGRPCRPLARRCGFRPGRWRTRTM